MRTIKIVACTLLTLSLAVPVDATSKRGRPATRGEIMQRALAAVKAGDAEAYGRLMLTRDDVKKYCPNQADRVSPDQMKRLRDGAAKSIARCSRLIDWSKAKHLRDEGGETGEKVDKCGGDLRMVSDIKVYFRVGEETFRLRLGDPRLLGGKIYVFGEAPSCSRSK